MHASNNLRGGEFLVKSPLPESVFVPEDFDEEQQMLATAIRQFIQSDIVPKIEEIETQKDPKLIPSLLDRAAELGMLGLAIPEEYGGTGVNFNTDLLLMEAMSGGASFSAAMGLQTGIGMVPIMYYGSPEQKQKYLPKLVSGEYKCCYCLTEPEAGSDANSGKTRAKLNEAGTHYLVNGQKMWITNGGFANLMVVFSKIEEDETLSAFIIEESFGGITKGDEEKKMGLKGSSTVQLFFTDCPVPKENLLGKRGEGFKMALNMLNIGRIKLAAGVIGAIKAGVKTGVEYSKNRKQFGKSISEFGAIKYKIAEMMIRSFALESATYRAGNDIELEMSRLQEGGMEPIRAKMKSIEQYVIECSILKVYGSEVAAYIVDEAVQIFGGMGFSEEGPVARSYRDSRILRIFEGTNEINRMLTVGMFFKKVGKKEINMKAAVGKAFLSLIGQIIPWPTSGEFGKEQKCLSNLKRLFLLIAAQAASKLQMKLIDEQEILMNLADIMIEIYVAESALMRTLNLANRPDLKPEKIRQMKNISRILIFKAVENSRIAAKEAILSFATGTSRSFLLFVLRKLSKTNLVNVKVLRREVADFVLSEGKYPF